MSWAITHDVEQGSDEWHDLRRGKITGSRANSLFKTTTRGWSTSRGHIVSVIAMELLRGEKVRQGYMGSQVDRGHEYEPQGVISYEARNLVEATPVGFMTVADHPNEGASPDRLIGSGGVLEIKVPTALEKHVDYLRNDSHAVEYEGQLRHTLYVTGREWIDIASYYPEAAPNLQLAVKRLTRADLKLCRLHALLWWRCHSLCAWNSCPH